MPLIPDLATVRLCSLLESAAFALVFVVLRAGRRSEAYWLHWLASSTVHTASLPAALHFADGLRLALRRVPGLPGWSVSMGVAMVAHTDTSLAEGIVRADRALYQAKAAGRDRSAA